jgi:Caspase domain
VSRIVYALLAGIDDYRGGVKPLRGCVDDIRGFQSFLEGRINKEELRILRLVDADATREGIINGFSGHLANAGEDDVAIFYFSGHGSYEPVEERYWFLEPTGFNQTIVCADSRLPGIPDLADKELSELIGVVAARGPHVLVVLDCCHSGGGTRDPEALPPGVRARLAPPVAEPRPVESYLPGVRRVMAMAAAARDSGSPPAGVALGDAPRHVALSACESSQLSIELPIGGRPRGVFSAMLQHALTTLGSGATYRDLLGAASAGVRDWVSGQDPVGYAARPGDLDQPAFGGAVQLRRSGITLEHYRGAWWIDAGTVHGVQPPQDGEATVLAVLPQRQASSPTPGGERPLGHVRVTDVELARSLVVTEDGWQPDPALRYPAVLTDVPLPSAMVETRGDIAAAALLREQLAGSPHVREGRGHPGIAGDRFLVLAEDGTLTVARADGTPLAAPVPATPDGARTVVARLEHLARWHLIKRLDNPVSVLAGQITVEIVPAERSEQPPLPGQRLPVALGKDGLIHLPYRQTPAGLQHPYVFIYLHNNSDRDLYCALLDMTDRFRCHSRLFPCDRIPARKTAVAYEGRPVDISVPQQRLAAGGTEVYDWLKLIAAEQRFDSDAYELPNLDGSSTPRSAARALGPRSVLDRLADRVVTRDAGEEAIRAGEWTTSLVTVRTYCPPAGTDQLPEQHRIADQRERRPRQRRGDRWAGFRCPRRGHVLDRHVAGAVARVAGGRGGRRQPGAHRGPSRVHAGAQVYGRVVPRPHERVVEGLHEHFGGDVIHRPQAAHDATRTRLDRGDRHASHPAAVQRSRHGRAAAAEHDEICAQANLR